MGNKSNMSSEIRAAVRPQITNARYVSLEQSLAMLRGWVSICQIGDSLIGTPVVGGVRGQAMVPAWCRNWTHCGQLAREYGIKLQFDIDTVSAFCQKSRYVSRYDDHAEPDSAACYVIVSVILGEHAQAPLWMIENVCNRMRKEIQEDIIHGRIPANVLRFCDLDEFVDSNMYGGFCEMKISRQLSEITSVVVTHLKECHSPISIS